MTGEGTAAKTGHRALKKIDAFFQGSIDIGDAKAAGVVQVQTDARRRQHLAHGVDPAFDIVGTGPADGVGQDNGR